MVGRKPLVSSDKVVEFIIKNIKLFATSVPVYSDPIWKEFSEYVVHWKPDTAYNHVKNNRNKDLTKARLACDIVTNDEPFIQPTFKDDHELEDVSFTNLDLDSSYEDDFFHKKSGHIPFNYELKQSYWDQIKPQDGGRKLTKKVWTNVITQSFWENFHLPCAYVIEHHYVSYSPVRNFFVKMEGHCIEKKYCKNTFVAIIKEEPRDKPPIVEFYTRDTRLDDHENVKRPCNGHERVRIGKELQASSAVAYRRKMAQKLVPEGGNKEPPFLPNADVLRHAKKEAFDRELDINPSQNTSVFLEICKMIDSDGFKNIVRYVGWPFYCYYSTPFQLTNYQEYCRLEQKPEICLDATGSLVQEIVGPGGKKSGSIFLYVITINWQNDTYAVNQMLSTIHSSHFIAAWIKNWINDHRAPIPRRTVTDYGRALLLALCDAFNGMCLNDYIDLCFDWLMKKNKRLPLPKKIKSIHKIDVAHVIHFVTRWKCFRDQRGKLLKSFFVRVVALMIDCNCVDKFQELYLLTCIVCLHEFSDSTINIPLISKIYTVDDAITALTQYVSDREVFCDLMAEVSDTIKIEDRHPDQDYNKQQDQHQDTSNIRMWIQELRSKAEKTEHIGKKISSLYLPEFIESFSTLANEFPLWTGLMTPSEKKHASSAYGEGYFSYLKNCLLGQITKRITAEKFVKLHIRDCQGNDVLVGSKIVKFIAEKRKEILTHQEMIENNNSPKHKNRESARSLNISPIAFSKAAKVEYETWMGKRNKHLEVLEVDSEEDESKIDEAERPVQKPETPVDGYTGNDNRGDTYKLNSWNDDDDDSLVDNKTHPPTSSQSIDTPNFDHPHVKDNTLQSSIPSKIRRKYTLKEVEQEPGHYFRTCPEINLMRHLNQQRPKKQYNLPNGNTCISVPLDGKFILVTNTCGFDSLAQAIHCAVLDDDKYWTYVSQSSQPLFKFVTNFSLTGSTQKILIERAKILSTYIEVEKDKKSPTVARIFNLDAETWLTNHWKNLLPSEPSIMITYSCDNPDCAQSPEAKQFIECNWNVILDSQVPGRGFRNLQDALFLPNKIGRKCNYNNCPGIILNQEIVGNRQILVDLDVRAPEDRNNSQSCSLNDIPVTLELDTKYRLIAVVQYKSKHFTVYCRRVSFLGNVTWQLYNSQPALITKVDATTTIVPNAAIYIK